MASAAAEWEEAARKVLVARKPGFGLPTACPTCLPVLLYLRMAQVPFDIHVDTSFPDADHIPYVEFGDCVAFNNEKGGVIQYLKEEKIVDLNSKHPSVSSSDVLPTKAMVLTWLADALQYELWVVTDGSIAHDIYFSDLPWPIGKILHWKKSRDVKQLLGITKLNAAEKEKEIYQNASAAYDALSSRLGDQVFIFDNSPTDVDALFLGHALFVFNALPDASVLLGTLQKHDNLVNFAKHHKAQLLEASSLSAVGSSPDPPSSSTPRKRASTGRTYKPKPRAKKERTEEEKTFRRRAKYFLATQLAAVLAFLSLMGGVDSSELDEDGVDYED
ncbi:mitochondrial outer membrane import complex protein METAXIN-like [Phragmites australis]|uniref:mitochondrial outer membrane import complex protein METAXIN-like n=1 Tax=Phragmites australis TaxID=29695 RepID=UPI002D78B040|nr:mitochondrial outer membrane import complex protein METAXIN-like [Phragmites australis]